MKGVLSIESDSLQAFMWKTFYYTLQKWCLILNFEVTNGSWLPEENGAWCCSQRTQPSPKKGLTHLMSCCIVRCVWYKGLTCGSRGSWHQKGKERPNHAVLYIYLRSLNYFLNCIFRDFKTSITWLDLQFKKVTLRWLNSSVKSLKHIHVIWSNNSTSMSLSQGNNQR